jgi:hypothetical protein
MSTYNINLNEQTATSINSITFKLTETKPGEYEGVYLNPKDIPPDDLDDVILGRMIKEAGMWYRRELGEQYDTLRHKGADESIQNTLQAISKAINGANFHANFQGQEAEF